MFGIAKDMIYAGYICPVLDPVVQDPSWRLHKLGQIIDVTCCLYKFGQGKQIIVRGEPFVTQTIKIHITTYVGLIWLFWIP